MLTSGQPNKETDQDTYEALMTMEDKEIKFWKAHPEFEIPFIAECGMNWEKIVSEYEERLQREKENGILEARENVKTILSELSTEDIQKFVNEGILPKEILAFSEVDPKTGNILLKKNIDYTIYTLNELLEIIDVSGTLDEI